MYLPDPQSLYVTMGTMAGNMLTGNPTWLMLVGSSGSGKTMLLKSLRGLPRIRPVASIKGEAALLSGVKAKDRADDATGGILREIGDNGCLIFMDFTSVLSKSREAVTELLGVLRELYDGTWVRDIGGEGGRSLTHTGRVSVIAGVTNAIDRHYEVNSEMGQRCLYYRIPSTDGYQESLSAVNAVDPDGRELERQNTVTAMFHALDLSFAKPTRRRELSMREAHRVVSLAQLGAKLRSGVPRDWRDRTVVDVPSDEVATRMAQQMTQLYLGMEMLGVNEQESWAAIEKVTYDSMPLLRRLVLKEIEDGIGKPAEVARRVRVAESAARRAIEDLELLGVVEQHKSKHAAATAVGKWALTAWAVEKMAAGKTEVTEAEDETE